MRSWIKFTGLLAATFMVFGLDSLSPVYAAEKDKEKPVTVPKEVAEINRNMASDTKKVKFKKHEKAKLTKKPNLTIVID